MSDAPRRLTRSDVCDLFGIPFTSEQLDAITAPHRPAVVIAGAGSGKTALMSARVVWLVALAEVEPDQVLGLTFTNKAASELSTRVRSALRLLDNSPDAWADGEPTISTYHAYAAALLREYGLWAGLEPSAQLLTDAGRVQLAESVVRGSAGPFPALGLRLTSLTERLLTLDTELNEHLVDVPQLMAHDAELIAQLDAIEEDNGKLTAAPKQARQTARARRELAPVVAAFRRQKRLRERVDFGDQMASAASLAEQVDEARSGERERFATVLLDEYQDTSMAQRRLLVALFGKGHPVMAVGDPFQSIYGWRGASVRNILTFDRDFADPEPAPIFALGQNNRSGGVVLAAANAVAEPLRGAFPEVAELTPQPQRAETGELVVALFQTASDEIDAVCDAVAHEIDAGRPAAEIAILCRESKVFTHFIDGLNHRDVPVDVVGLGGLLQLPEVVEVLSVLEVLHDPTANPSLVRLLTGPRWRIGPVDLAQLGARASQLAGGDRRGRSAVRDETVGGQLREAVTGIDPAETVSLIEALEDPGPGQYSSAARQRFAQLAEELRQLRAVLHQPPDVAIMRVVAAIGLDVELAAHGHSSRHLDALTDQARSFMASGGGAGVGSFLAYLALARRYRSTLAVEPPGGGDGVALLTIHKAKGLEWSSVYVPQVAEGVFPSGQSRSTPLTSPALLPYVLRGDADDFPVVSTWTGNKGVAAYKQAVLDRERGEDRRLAYVAVTRAAERLQVTGHRWGPTQSTPRRVSPHLQTLADLCESGGGTISHWAEEPTETQNPALAQSVSVPWPPDSDPDIAEARAEAASRVLTALGQARGGDGSEGGERLTDAERDQLAAWDADIAVLLAEAERQSVTHPPLPAIVSASSAVEFLRDPERTVERIRRPLPKPPATAAHRGTRFHQWVETRFGQVPLLDADSLVPEGASDPDADLESLQLAFLKGPYADRQPVAIEAPFQLVLGDQLVSGRIDAVYAIDDDSSGDAVRYEVVDWKTGRHPADQLQLALYRLAWAELHGLPVEQVAATFYYVATGRVEQASDLPGREALTEWWRGLKA